MSLLHSSAPTFSSKTLASKFYQSEMKTPENFYNDDCSNETSISPDFVVSKYVKPTSSIPFDAVDDSSFCSSHIEGEIPKVSIGGKSSRIPEKQSTFLERLISSGRMEDAFMWLEESLDMNEWKVFQPPTFKTMLEVFKEFKFKPVTNHSDLTFSAFSHSSISSSSHHDSSLSSVSSFSSSSSASSSESPSSSESSSSESSSSSSSFASSGSQSSSSSSSSSDSVVSSSFEPSSSSSSDSTSSSSSFSSVSSSFCSSSLSSLSSSSFRPSLLDHDHHPLDENAIRRVLKAIPRSSQPGLDGWSMNLLLRCITIKSSILTSLQSCLNKMLHLNWFPKIWFTDRLIIVPVGHHQSSLRVTTTMNLFRIILSKTVLLLSEHTLLKQIPFTQYGIDFSWGRETVLALLTNIIDISKLSKSSLIISNMTLSSPLQSVDKSILLSQLKSINAPSSLLKFTEFYFSSSRLLYLENPIPLETTFQIGLLRKCPLTPVLFSLYTNEILVKINQLKHSQQNFGEIPSLSSRIHPPIKHILDKLEIPRVIAYFDSIFLMSATKDEAAYSFKVCFDAATHLKLTPNLHKSTSLLLDDTGNPKMESCISIGLDKNSEVISISSSATPFLRGRMESSPSVSSDQIILDITPQSSLHSLGTIVSPFGKERNISFQDRCNKLLKLLHLASDCLTSQYFLLFARWVVIMKIVSQLANFSIHSNLLHNFDIQLNDLIRKTLNFPKESPIVLINFPLNKSGLGIPAVRDLYVMCSLMTHITVKSRNYMLQNFEKEFQKQLEPDVLPPSDNLEIDLSAYSTDLKLPLTFTDIECEHFSGTFCLISRYIQTHNEPDFNSNSKVVLHQLWETLHNSKYNMLLEKMNPSVIDKWKMNKISSMFTSDWHILKILPKSSFERFSNQEMEQFFSLNLPGQTNELHSSLLKSITSDDSQFIEILGSMSTHITFQLASFIRTVPGCQIKIKESGEENLLIKIIISNSIQTNEEKLLNLTRDSNHQIHLIIEVKVTKSIVPDSIDESDSIPDTTPTSFVQIIKFKTSLKGELGNKAKILLRMLFMMSKAENRNQFMYLFRKHYSLVIQSGNIFLQHRTIKSQPSIIQPIQELSFWRDIYKSSFFLPYLNQIILNHHDGLINIEKYLDDIPDRLRSMLESYSLFLDYHAKCPGWIFNSSSEIVVKSQTEQPKVSTSRESKLLPSTSSPEHTIITTPSLPVSNSIPTAILTGSSLSTGSSHQSSKRRVPFPRTPLMEHDSLLLLKKALQEQSPSLSHPTLAQVPTTGQIKIFPTNEGPLLQKIMPRKKEQNRSFESTASHHDSSAESDSTSSDNSDDGYSHDEYCSRHVRQRKRLDSSFDISGFVLSTKSEAPTKMSEETTPIHAASQITPSLVPEVSKSQPIIVLDEVFSLVPG
jgi:hypothetical protein